MARMHFLSTRWLVHVVVLLLQRMLAGSELD
jgi:hypothetical protein